MFITFAIILDTFIKQIRKLLHCHSEKTSNAGTFHSNMVLNYIGDTVQQQLKSIGLVFKQDLVVI